MKVVIIEDETHSAERLVKLIEEIDNSIEIDTILPTVKLGIEYFSDSPHADLLLLDIQLSDGNSFDIFDKITTNIPIIFTTAFDEYAIKAFKLNSIDYLLKPIDKEELRVALNKYRNILSKSEFDYQFLTDILSSQNKTYKQRFLVKKGNNLTYVLSNEISFFRFADGLVDICTFDNNIYLVDYTLDKIIKMIAPDKYFRINRQYIISIESIISIHTYFNSRLKLSIKGSSEALIVSRDKVKEFKCWLDR